MICKIDGDFIVRFMTSHPKDVPDKLIKTIAENPKIERHFHLPVQSGSDRVLRAMNREYTAEAYLVLTEKMKAEIPDLSLSTDIIVGFPGETEEDFEETLDAIRRVGYDMMFQFIYSKRDGTPAAKSEDQVPDEVKTERFKRLLSVQEPIAEALAQKYVGKTIRVLCEGKSKNNPEKYTGRDTAMKIVLFDGDER
ncbi:MAG: radical SAM protein [Eubacteriales bacterium]